MFPQISASVTDYINNVLRLIGTKWILYFKCSLQPSRYESPFSIKIILRAALTCKTKPINTGSQMVLGVCTSIIRALFIQQAPKSSLWGKRLALKERGKKKKSFVLGHQRCVLGQVLRSLCQTTGASAVRFWFEFGSFCLYFRTPTFCGRGFWRVSGRVVVGGTYGTVLIWQLSRFPSLY